MGNDLQNITVLTPSHVCVSFLARLAPGPLGKVHLDELRGFQAFGVSSQCWCGSLARQVTAWAVEDRTLQKQRETLVAGDGIIESGGPYYIVHHVHLQHDDQIAELHLANLLTRVWCADGCTL